MPRILRTEFFEYLIYSEAPHGCSPTSKVEPVSIADGALGLFFARLSQGPLTPPNAGPRAARTFHFFVAVLARQFTGACRIVVHPGIVHAHRCGNTAISSWIRSSHKRAVHSSESRASTR